MKSVPDLSAPNKIDSSKADSGRAANGKPRHAPPQRLLSVSLPCDGVVPLAMLEQAAGQARFYWRDPRSRITYVGVGVAAELAAWGATRFQAIKKQAKKLFANAQIAGDLPEFAAPQLFGGFSFTDNFTPDNTWSVYPPAQFILPHYQLAVADDLAHSHSQAGSWLTMNMLLEGGAADELTNADLMMQLQAALSARIDELRQPLPASSIFSTSSTSSISSVAVPELVSRNYPMSFAAWEQMLAAAKVQFQLGELQKVVLSRVCELRFRQNVALEQALVFLDQQYPDCYRFLFEPRPFHAFFGASPELLVDLRHRHLTTMGLAGSEPRGKTPEEDERLGNQLLNSPKDCHEHQLVVDEIRRRLQPLCAELKIAEQPTLLKLNNIQHLYTPVEGELHKVQSILDLVQQLHPTPALGGAPRDRALRFISEFEPAPRGWYAAPIGIINRHLTGTFSVAIRSAITEYERVWLHAGAGIVAASDAQKEWSEVALKFRPILNALRVTPL